MKQGSQKTWEQSVTKQSTWYHLLEEKVRFSLSRMKRLFTSNSFISKVGYRPESLKELFKGHHSCSMLDCKKKKIYFKRLTLFIVSNYPPLSDPLGENVSVLLQDRRPEKEKVSNSTVRKATTKSDQQDCGVLFVRFKSFVLKLLSLFIRYWSLGIFRHGLCPDAS